MDEQLHGVLGELVRRLGVEDDDADRVAVASEDRHRDHRLKALLLEQRDELHPRVVHRTLADELRRAMPRDPAGQSLVDRERDPVDGEANTGEAARIVSRSASSR